MKPKVEYNGKRSEASVMCDKERRERLRVSSARRERENRTVHTESGTRVPGGGVGAARGWPFGGGERRERGERDTPSGTSHTCADLTYSTLTRAHLTQAVMRFYYYAIKLLYCHQWFHKEPLPWNLLIPRHVLYSGNRLFGLLKCSSLKTKTKMPKNSWRTIQELYM